MGKLYRVEKDVRRIKKFEEPPEFLLGLEIVDDDDDRPIVSCMISGPPDSVFEGCVFTLRMVFKNDYRGCPPKVKFVTKCFHPNVSDRNGKVCLNLLSEDWSEKMNISLIIWGIWQLLKEPNTDSPLNAKAAKYFDKYGFDNDKVRSTVIDWADQEY